MDQGRSRIAIRATIARTRRTCALMAGSTLPPSASPLAAAIPIDLERRRCG
jgi:hypothetical protein